MLQTIGILLVAGALLAVLVPLACLCLAGSLLAWRDLLVPSRRRELDGLGKAGAGFAALWGVGVLGLALWALGAVTGGSR